MLSCPFFGMLYFYHLFFYILIMKKIQKGERPRNDPITKLYPWSRFRHWFILHLLPILSLFLVSYSKAAPGTRGFCQAQTRSHIYKSEALLPGRNAVITPAKVTTWLGVTSYPYSMFPNSKHTSFYPESLPGESGHSLPSSHRAMRGNIMLRPNPQGGHALLRVSAPTCLPLCQAGGGWQGSRGQREQGPNPLPLPPVHARAGLALRWAPPGPV